MKEFLLIIRNEMDHQASWTAEKTQQFLKACERYIEKLNRDKKLKSAQPLIREGKMISGSKGSWKEAPFKEAREVIVGYYHVYAHDLEEATALAKENPEFEFSDTASIEVRPVKVKEETTSFVYPNK
jgi:hypothetical protein